MLRRIVMLLLDDDGNNDAEMHKCTRGNVIGSSCHFFPDARAWTLSPWILLEIEYCPHLAVL